MTIKYICIISAVLILSACGGGSSSSGGSEFRKVFSGMQTLTLKVNGQELSTETVNFSLELTGNDVVIRAREFVAEGVANAGNFSAKGEYSFRLDDGSLCRSPITYTGTVIGKNVNGSVQNAIICENIAANIVGTFTAATSR